MAPEQIFWVFDELDEGDQQAPRVRTVDDESFQKHPSDLFLDFFVGGFGEEIEQRTRKIMRVGVGETGGDFLKHENCGNGFNMYNGN